MKASRTPGLFLLFLCLYWGAGIAAQDGSSSPTTPSKAASSNAPEESRLSTTKALESEFLTLLRTGEPGKLLHYISAGGVNVGSNAQHVSRKEIEEQLMHHEGIYCKLFDSTCIRSQVKLDDSNARQCSYRELLTTAQNVRTAATETTRNGVHQAFLVAKVKNEHCAGVGLIDFTFNAESDGWKLFSVP